MERHSIQVLLDDEIVTALEEYGKERGWDLEETIRYVLGQEMQHKTGGLAFPQRVVPLPSQATLSTSPDLSKLTQEVAQIVSSQGLAKCRACSQYLNADSIIKGECDNCGEKL